MASRGQDCHVAVSLRLVALAPVHKVSVYTHYPLVASGGLRETPLRRRERFGRMFVAAFLSVCRLLSALLTRQERGVALRWQTSWRRARANGSFPVIPTTHRKVLTAPIRGAVSGKYYLLDFLR